MNPCLAWSQLADNTGMTFCSIDQAMQELQMTRLHAFSNAAREDGRREEQRWRVPPSQQVKHTEHFGCFPAGTTGRRVRIATAFCEKDGSTG
jgi:hypothetical protein